MLSSTIDRGRDKILSQLNRLDPTKPMFSCHIKAMKVLVQSAYIDRQSEEEGRFAIFVCLLDQVLTKTTIRFGFVDET